MSAVVLIATFNLGGWHLVSLATNNLEREFSRRLLAIGRATVAGLNRERIERLNRPAPRQLIEAKLQEVREQLGISELFLFDPDSLVVADSRPRGEPRQAGYVNLEPELLKAAWGGRPGVSRIRLVKDVPFMDAYVPVPDLSGGIPYLLAVEDSPRRLAVFERIRSQLLIVGLISAIVVLLLAVSQVLAFRRLLEARRRASEAERFSALARLGATVAHEIRNPLTSLSATVQVVLRRLAKTGKVDEELLRGIPEEVDRVDRIVTDFLAFARESPVTPSSLSPASFLTEAVRKCAPEGRVGDVAVTLRIDDDLPAAAKADGPKLQQVLQNLVMNGAHAVQSAETLGGEVRVSGSIGRAGTGKPAWVIAVEDDGQGVPEQDRDRIFEPYYTSKAKGTGLGLAVARRIAEAHGGGLRCEDAEGGGARFVVTLPLEASA